MSNRDNLELIARYSKDHLKQSIGKDALPSNFISYALTVVVIVLLAFWGSPDTWHVANVLLWFLIALSFVIRLLVLIYVPIKREVENDNGTAGGEVYQYLKYVEGFKPNCIIASVLILATCLLAGHFGKAIIYGIACASTWFMAYFYWRKSYPAALAAARKATGATV